MKPLSSLKESLTCMTVMGYVLLIYFKTLFVYLFSTIFQYIWCNGLYSVICSICFHLTHSLSSFNLDFYSSHQDGALRPRELEELFSTAPERWFKVFRII